MDPHRPTIADSSFFQMVKGDASPLLLLPLLFSRSSSLSSIAPPRFLRVDPARGGRIGRAAALALSPEPNRGPLSRLEESALLFSNGLRRDSVSASSVVSPRSMDSVIATARRAHPLGTNPRAILMSDSLQLTVTPLACRHGRVSSA